MLLAAGTRVGVYQIVAPLGAGGPPMLTMYFVVSFGEVSP